MGLFNLTFEYMVLFAKMKVDNDSKERSAHVICLPPSSFYIYIYIFLNLGHVSWFIFHCHPCVIG